ncbi:acyl-CoA dehydrogenase family protein [Caballeronia sp. AZ7_KS35]|uniref:acyl-CoA dehydrogenase family protein n=1 Tax=Caballeronia sp. AZ7_KS35 TaxID=2921762 RepID=UPI0020295B2C|nr:acyl-CoA dehydrogenase family protein [Caballeronia sp. AZ7_KS35]
MRLEYSSEQIALADSVARFAERDYAFEQRRKVVRSEEGISREHWATFAKLGWFGAGLAEAEGGFGGSAVENAVLFEGFGRMLLVEPVLAHAVLALQALAGLPPGPARDELIEPAVAGETILTLAHDEPQGWGSLDWVECAAASVDGNWQLSGAKSRVLGGTVADTLIVSARVAGAAANPDGIGLFLVNAGAPGLSRRPYRLVDNSRVADIALRQTPAQLLARGRDANGALARATRHAIVASCAEALGAMEAALWQTRDYLKTRSQFGSTLNHFQALQHRMADMLIETELSRSMLLQALAALGDAGPAGERGIAAAKVAIARSALFVTGQAIQLHGGIGMTDELAVGHYYKRALVVASLFGDVDHHFEQFLATSRASALTDDFVATVDDLAALV